MAAFYLADFERATDDAFAFLMAESGYTALPAERGGMFGSGFLRRFVRGSHRISVVFADADAHHLCGIEFDDDVGQNIARRVGTARNLATLLAKRRPEFVHSTRADLSGGATPQSIIARYGKALRQYASDVVQGDFSVFPPLIYVLHHVDRKFPEAPVRRFLGVYSRYDFVSAAIEGRRSKRGYLQRSDGFEVWRIEVDGDGFWFAGIPLDDPREV